jgi:hypothetical protein
MLLPLKFAGKKKVCEHLFMKSELNLKKSIFIVFILFSLFYIALGFQAIAVTDDFWLATYVLKKSSSFFMSFDWATRQFFGWTGQYILSFLQGLFTFKPLKTNIISGLHGILFLGTTLFWILDSYKKWESERESRVLFAITILLCFFICTFGIMGETIFLAASEYVWSYLFFVLCYLSLRSNLFSKFEWAKYIFFFALGNSCEFLIFPVMALFWMTRKDEINSRKKIIGSYLVGLLIYIFSPGTFIHLRTGLASASLNLMDQLYHVQIVMFTAFNLLGMKMFYALPLMLVSQPSSLMNLGDLRDRMLENLIFSLLALVIFIPVVGQAAGSAYFYFLMFFTLTIFWLVQYLKRRFLQYRFPLIVHESALLLYLFTGLWLVSVNFFNATKIRESFIQIHTNVETMAKESKKIEVPNHFPPIENHILYYADITKDPQDINNQARTEYYELESIVAN